MLTDMSNKESFDSADLSLAYKRKKGKRRVKTSNLSSKWSSTTLYTVQLETHIGEKSYLCI